jgi:hypothetical protein
MTEPIKVFGVWTEKEGAWEKKPSPFELEVRPATSTIRSKRRKRVDNSKHVLPSFWNKMRVTKLAAVSWSHDATAQAGRSLPSKISTPSRDFYQEGTKPLSDCNSNKAYRMLPGALTDRLETLWQFSN